VVDIWPQRDTVENLDAVLSVAFRPKVFVVAALMVCCFGLAACERGYPTEEEDRANAFAGFAGDMSVQVTSKTGLNGVRRFGVAVTQLLAAGETAAGYSAWEVTIDNGVLGLLPSGCTSTSPQSASCTSGVLPVEVVEMGVDAQGPVTVRVVVPHERDINGEIRVIDPDPNNNTATLTVPAT
jgi:hypothetical protein